LTPAIRLDSNGFEESYHFNISASLTDSRSFADSVPHLATLAIADSSDFDDCSTIGEISDPFTAEQHDRIHKLLNQKSSALIPRAIHWIRL
jgi:hypothetical protein